MLDRDPVYGEVDLMASAKELGRLAEAVARRAGLLAATAAPNRNALMGIEVRATPGPGVLLHHDPERHLLVIGGDAAARAVLAENLRGMAAAGAGGHLHVEYHPDHFYLAEGSLPLVVNSPHAGMPKHRE
ncbi:hypothetical protein [Kitasatospora sp. A2-31]|uniref:Imm32 family immunity protein n=1 Tax=Kitasatospora sp. A2-31 TaxID=2916414 RepID=UPI001EEB0668|nr:hypothetical protein [Kitasatospora sp. A2-31]MCG6498278.1 hypothetical protein [Kitasatospora sp. A2-31]